MSKPLKEYRVTWVIEGTLPRRHQQESEMTKLTLSKDGKTTTVAVNRNPASSHPNAGIIPQRRMRNALRRIDAAGLADCQHDARELWAFHGGYFVAWKTA